MFSLNPRLGDLRLETQNIQTFKKLFFSIEALDQKYEKMGPQE